MDHKTLKDMIFALYDGQLDEASRRQAQAHLADCRECRQSYESWAKTAKAIFRAPKTQTSEFFVQSVMNRIHDLEKPEAPARWSWHLPLRWLAPAVGAAFIFLLVMPLPSPPLTQNLSMESFLFQGSNEYSSWINSNSAMSADDTLQYIMEGPA